MAELKTFLFTDICGSVRLKNEMTGRSVTERDMAFIQTVLTPHRLRIEQRLKEMGGRVVSTAGDGHFLVFDNTIQAAQWAVEVQESHRDDPIATPGGENVEVRLSIHVGVPQVDPADPDNFVGKTVDYAARLNDYATGGQILVSRSVMAILDDVGLEGLRLHLHGRRNLKGIGNVEVHELLYDDVGPRQMRNQPKTGADHRQWTVVPTMGFEGDSTGPAGKTVALAGSALTRVGNYELEEQLGAGGMGDVYKARHSQFGRVRAVKVIKPQFVGPGHEEIVRRFYNEIKAVGKLEHKNIVVAIDSSAPHDNVHYLVMEYIEGVGLDELVAQRGPLRAPDACEIARQAARGLQYIHKHGMVHRDIKPSNLMLAVVDADQLHSDSSVLQQPDAQRGVVKILDLGLALLAEDGGDRLTRFDNKAMGTGMYMSPEQWKTTTVDIRADIYSLGCTLYHLLAGNPPFYDSDLRPEKAHEKEPLPPIRSGDQVPRKLWDVLRKMLAKRPESRFATPAEVAAALQAFTDGHDLPALMQSHDAAGAPENAHVRTYADRPSDVDTWRSKVLGGASGYYPTRRWVLGTALPLLVLAVLLLGALLTLSESRNQAVAEAERSARNNLPAVARNAARNKLAQQLSQRFEILLEALEDPVVSDQLEKINANKDDRSLWEPLSGWIQEKFINSLEEVPADSWFINNVHGTQVARSPPKDSVGKNYAYRDYFHGQGQDLEKGRADGVEPIDVPHLSAVYESSTSHKLKVAFSVPVRRPGGDGEAAVVLGILAMSVDVGAFEVLDRDLTGGNEVVLVDTRTDTVDGEPKRGLILHHKHYSGWKETRPPRVSSEVLAVLESARPRGEDQFVAGYTDPIATANGPRYWGAYEPVEFQLKSARGGKYGTGWVVLVQHPVFAPE